MRSRARIVKDAGSGRQRNPCSVYDGFVDVAGRAPWLALAACLALIVPLRAQVPQPKLNALAPVAFQLGTTNEVTVSGAELDEPSRLLFSDARISGQPRSGGFTVIVPTNASLGVVEARFVGRFGVSSPRRLWIGPDPELVLAATNHSRADAFSLPAAAAVNGRLEVGKVAWFRLAPPRTNRLLLHVATTALDSRAEPDLAVFDEAGRELARSRHGGVLALTPAPAGELWISLNDLRFLGGEGYGYRLTHGALAEVAREALGNAARPLAAASIRESESHPLIDRAPAHSFVEIKPPAEIHGVFPRRGQLTGVTFSARKGEVYWIELTSERLGYVTDPAALLQRIRSTKGDKGETLFADVVELPKLDANVGGVEYPTGSRDVAGRFEAPEDATYRVLIRDRFAQSAAAAMHPWRLNLRRETPGVSLVVVPAPPPRQVENDRQIHGTAINLRRGETAALKVLAFRHDGFNGEIELVATNLPPGITTVTTRIASGQRVGSLLLTAADSLTNGVDAITILGRFQVDTNTLTCVARAGVALWSMPDWDQQRPPAQLTDAVVIGRVGEELAPISVLATTNVFEVVAGGKINATFQVERRGEFTAGFKLKPTGRSELEKAKELDIAEKGTNATVELNLADAALPVGTHVVWLEGRAAGKYRNQPGAIEVARADLKAAEESLAKISASEKPAAEKRKQEAADRLKAAEERAKPRDVFAAVVSRPFSIRVLPAK